VSLIKGADIIVCTVYYFFLLAVLLLLGVTLQQVLLDFSVATCVFCLQCMRAIWPRVFRGRCHNAISKIVANE
jgi:hypothetical protein